ncbi:MAG TPA: molybdenum cofactor guanylyltransferase [Kofleriaceae bacterium]|nr:molybdenum cofactor guanylyltransferase [Kofleriaceae bacterium]
MHDDVSALILAGGKATRFGGIAKHELVVDGETIFARQVRVLAPRVAEVLVSSTRDIAGYRTVRDATPGAGPLAGIAAGLAACRTPWLLVLAGDMPYITDDLVDRLIGARGAIDAVGIRVGGLPEPLVCVLHGRVLSILERRIASGDYKASRLLTDAGLRVRWIDDADPAALRNVNSPEDLGR